MRHTILMLILLMLSILVGCTATTPSYDIDKLQDACESQGGLYKINNILHTSAICNDGSPVYLTD